MTPLSVGADTSLQGDVNNREEGEVFGQGLLNLGFIHHVTDEHVFKDKHLFYRWTTDDEISKAGGTCCLLCSDICYRSLSPRRIFFAFT